MDDKNNNDPENKAYVDEVMKILVNTLIVAEEHRGKSIDELEEWYNWYDVLFEDKK